ncbi:MAG: flavin reductase family protein, partial [bacterium]
MILESQDFKRLLNWPTLLITTYDSAGVVNAAAYGCIMPILRPLDLLVFASAYQRDTLRNIKMTREFTVNVPLRGLEREVMICSQPFAADINELEQANLHEAAGKKVKSVRIKECGAWIECCLEEIVERENYALVIGKVLLAEIEDEYCLDNGAVNFSAYRPIYS